MRELKFRAWQPKIKAMCIVGSFDCARNPAYYFSAVTGFTEDAPNLSCPRNRKEEPDFVLMQYTGLKDKNGKEIYEGDVIREDSPPHHCGEIKYDGGAFYISGITDGYSELCHILVDEFWAVIGDIYENPELLKGK